MAHYLVRGRPRDGAIDELRERLRAEAFVDLEPFGAALTRSLRNARRDGDTVVWEEEDYCSPPLAEEREAVLDEYFEDIRGERVERGEGWGQIESLDRLFPALADGRSSGS
ncbi:MAG: hypothetical protein ABEL76_14645 [Bradymonadaceae bacterium]